MWIVVVATIVPLTIWYAYLKPYRHWKKMGVKQTNPCILFGDSLPIFLQTVPIPEWVNRVYYMHPESRYTGLYQFYTPTLLIKDPELIKQLAVKDFDHFTDHNIFDIPEDVDAFWSNNLFALRGQKWRDMRGLLSGSFTSSKMKIIYTLISETSGNFINHFLSKNQDFIEVELKDTFTRYTNDVIASTSFGIKVNSFEDPQNEFYLMGKEATDFTDFVTILKFLGFMICPRILKVLKVGVFTKRVKNFFIYVINETIRVREEQGIVRPDMINLMLEVKNGVKRSEEKEVIDTGFAVIKEAPEIAKPQKRQIKITNADIVSQAMIFFLAGFDTVSSTMCFLFYELAVNPDIQDKLRKEIQETLEDCGEVTYETLLKMKYMDMVVSESLRKWPVGVVADRVCVKPYTLEPSKPGGPAIHFRKDDMILIPVFSIHRDPNNYPDPEKFDPERFSDENKGNIKPYTYLPFGVGPRACIGSRFALLEIKSVVFQLLNNFEVVPVEKTAIPLKLSKTSFELLAEGGFPLGFKRLK